MKKNTIYFILILASLILIAIVLFKNKTEYKSKALNIEKIENLNVNELYTYEEFIRFLKSDKLSNIGKASYNSIANSESYKNCFFQIFKLDSEYINTSSYKFELVPEYIFGFEVDKDSKINKLKFAGGYNVYAYDQQKNYYNFDGEIEIHLVSDYEMNSLVRGFILDKNKNQIHDIYIQRDYFLSWIFSK